MTTRITVDLIRAALEYIPASLPRDDWAKVCAAIKSEFPDEVGRDLFTSWSATSDSFDPKAVASTWKSLKASGGVGIGTLLAMAKERGFVIPKDNQAAAPPDPATAARLDSQRKAAQAAERAAQEAAQQAAALEAVRLWDSASPTGEAPYLVRKGVQPYGVRFGAGGWLYVPMRDSAGMLWNVQRIAPKKPDKGSDKFYLKDGRKSGLWHLCGAVDDENTDPAVVLIAEGYATAASLHQATGYPVAVAFDVGNLGHVAKSLRNKYPAALLVLCGDDDLQTFAQRGNNPGRDAATKAASAVRGLAVFAANLPEGCTDFNDLQVHLGGSAGLDAVRAIVQTAIDQHRATQTSAQSAQTANAGKGGPSPSYAPTEPQNAGGFDRFFVTDGDNNAAGLFYVPRNRDGEDGKPQRVCGVLRVTGLARDAHDNQAALLLEFVTEFGKVRTWLMPLAMLAGDGNAYRTALLSQAFMTPTDSRRRALLTDYLQSRNPDELERVRHVPRVGWSGRCYVLPNETLGNSGSGERVIFHSEAGVEANFSQRGTLEQWRADLSRLCVGNSRALFAVATAFAGPLLRWAPGTTGGGVHYVGSSSIGKTTCFLIAASVWGKGTEKDPDSYMQKWRATGPALEYLSEQHNDCTLILDELGQLDPKEAGKSAYMMADGAGKNRSQAKGGLRAKPSWALLYLSSGELTLSQHMEAAGEKQKAGQEVRLIPVPTEVKEGTALETFHEFNTGHEISSWVQGRAAKCYGTAGRAWLEYLVSHTDTLSADLRDRMDTIETELVPAGASGQVKRGVKRFALIAAAGEMATAAGLTGWPEGAATWAARACLDAWIATRGGAGNSEKAKMLQQVRSFFEAHGESRFGFWHRAGDDHAGKIINRAGLRRVFDADGTPYKDIGNKALDIPLGTVYEDGGTVTYYVLPDVFVGEVCRGIDVKAVCTLLEEGGCLQTKEPGRYSVSTKLPGIGKVRCYCITDAIHSIEV